MARSIQNDKQPPSIPPPVPAFRSVSMSVNRAASPSLQRVEQTPLLHKSHSSPFAQMLDTQSIKSNQSSNNNCWVWRVAQISPVPIFHPLERSSISSTEAPDTITERISNFMKSRSIKCSYDDQLGRVECSTDYLLHFVLQLWKKNNSTIVVEIQRRQGCAIAMQGLRQELAQIILHGEDTSKTKSAPSSRVCSFLQQLPIELPEKSPDCLEQCLEVCESLLRSDLLCQNRLGLESLCFMTDPSKVVPHDAQETSRRILQASSLQSYLAKFVDPDADAMNYDEHMFGAMHLLTLKLVSHSLATVAQEQHDSFSIDSSSSFWKTLVAVSCRNIQLAKERPLEASLSIRSLRLLHAIEPSALSSLQQQRNLSESLQSAHEYGRQHHQSLQKETELLMMIPTRIVY